MYNLALLYGEGKGVERNFETSLFWLRKAAEKKSRVENFVESGIADAQHALGQRYSDGIWVAQNYKEAAKWYQMAVKNGYGPSANNLGLFYKNGTGVKRSLEKAFELFKMAAMKGDTPGMMNLAECYLMAEGTGSFMPFAADMKMALDLLQKAASLGDTYAAEKLENIKKLPLGHFQMTSLCSLSTPQVIGFQNSLSDKHCQYLPAVKTAAEKGSETALELLTIWDCQRASMDAFKSGDHTKLVQRTATALRLDLELVEVPELFRSVVERRMEEQPDELDTIVCYIGLNFAKGILVEFIGNCLEKFPTDPFLVEMRAIGLSTGPAERHGEAIKLIETGLQSHPNNVRLLYYRALFFSMDAENQNSDNVQGAWDAFLAVAPADHKRVPAAYYRKAENNLCMGDAEKCVQYYKMGQTAEKELLPCFLPYDSSLNDEFEKTIKLMEFVGMTIK